MSAASVREWRAKLLANGESVSMAAEQRQDGDGDDGPAGALVPA